MVVRKHLRDPQSRRMLAAALAVLSGCALAIAQANSRSSGADGDHDPKLRDFQVFEFRRYAIKPGERKQFAQYFEAYSRRGFNHLELLAPGLFRDRGTKPAS